MSTEKADAFEYGSESEFVIKKYEDFSALVGLGNRDFSGKTIRLFCDIDLEKISAENLTFSSFKGTFEGNGHVIYGCRKNLFGNVYSGAVVENIVLDRCALTTQVALASENRGTIRNVVLHGTQINSRDILGVVGNNNEGTMEKVVSYLDITTSSQKVCLLCGGGNNSLTDCAFLGTVTSTTTDPDKCSDLRTRTVAGANLIVSSCKCNPIETYHASGKTTGLSEHATAIVPNAILSAFGDLATEFSAFMADYVVTSELNEWVVTDTTDYNSFYTQAKSVFDDSNIDVSKNLTYDVSSGAVIGIGNTTDKRFGIVFDNQYKFVKKQLSKGAAIAANTYYEYDATAGYVFTEDAVVVEGKSYYEKTACAYADYLSAVAKLFGYQSTTDFSYAADKIAEALTHVGGYAEYDGAIYANGLFIFPFAVKNPAEDEPVLIYLIVDPATDMTYAWISDVFAALEASNHNGRKTVSSTVSLYGRCSLFELPRSAAYSVRYEDTPGGGYKTKVVEYSYLSVYPFSSQPATDAVKVNSCTAIFSVNAGTLPCVIYPCMQLSSESRVIATYESQLSTQPGMVFDTPPTETSDVVVDTDDSGFTGVLSSYVSVQNDNCKDGYVAVYYNTGTPSSVSYSSLVKVWDGGKNNTDDLADLSAAFFTPAGCYPVQMTSVDGAGTSVDPISISCAEDYYAFKRFVQKTAGTVCFSLTDDIDFSRAEPATALFPLTVSVEGNNYHFYNQESGFLNTSVITCSDSNVNYFRPDLMLVAASLENVVFTDSSTEVIPAMPVDVGSGTAGDPYVIKTAGQLKGLIVDAGKNVSGKYAFLSNDIILNTQGHHGNRLDLGSDVLNLTINGCGHTVYGLSNESLVGTISATGAIADLIVKTTEVSGVSPAAAAVTGINSGEISSVAVTGDGKYVSSYVTANTGVISLCSNDLVSDYAFCTENTGEIRYCLNPAFKGALTCSSFDGSDTGEGCLQCVHYSNANYYLYNGLTVDAEALIVSSTAGYVLLSENGYDFTTYGYEAGVTPSVMPVIRSHFGTYKEESAFVLMDNEDITFSDLCYSTDSFAVPDDEEIEDLIWTCYYDGVTTPMTREVFDNEDVVKEVGTYTLSLIVKETDDTLPKRVTTSFDILQAACPVTQQAIAFSNVSVTYTGEPLDTTLTDLSSDLTAQDLRTNYGYEFAFTYTTGNTNVLPSEIINVNTYQQSYVASSRNYVNITPISMRTISVTKASVAVTVTSDPALSVRYGSELTYQTVSANAAFLGVDSGYNLAHFVPDYADRLVTNYLTTTTAGAEGIFVWLNVNDIVLDNYVLTMPAENRCPVTIARAPILQGDISFYGATASVTGAYAFTYDGLNHLVEATGIPSGFSATYNRSTSFKDAGNYLITLTVDDPGANDNYEALVLAVDVTVSKATLTVTATNVTKVYGYEVSYGDFDYVISGFCQGDDSSVLSALDISARPSFAEGTIPGVDTYEIALYDDSGYNFAVANYTLTRVAGEFIVTKIPLTQIYDNNASVNISFADGTKVYDGEDFNLSGKVINFFETRPDVEITDIVYVYYFENDVIINPLARNVGTYKVIATVTPAAFGNYSETEYICTFTITKKPTSLSFTSATGYESNFSAGAYTYAYVPGGTVDYAAYEYCPYIATDIPDGGVVQYVGDSGVVAGTHTVIVRYMGDANHEGCSATATLTVKKFTAAVSVTRTYGYTGASISPEVTVVTDTHNELTPAYFTYSYTDKLYLTTSSRLLDAGEYTLTLTSFHDNYDLSVSDFDVIVAPMEVSVEVPSFSFAYGTLGDYEYTDASNKTYSFYIENNYVTLRNYLIKKDDYPALSRDVGLDVRFRLYGTDFDGYFRATTYVAQGIEQPRNFVLSFARTATVTVKRRAIDVQWLIDDGTGFKNCDDARFVTEYTGIDRTATVSYEISGFVSLEEQSAAGVRLSIIKRNTPGTIKNICGVGEYACTISLEHGENYSIDPYLVTLIYKVTKRSINIYVDDLTVQQYEAFPQVTFSTDPSGLVGKDVGVSLTSLDGFSITAPTSTYVPSSAAVGQTYGFDVEITFADYEPHYVIGDGRTTQAVLTVVANTIPKYTLTGMTFVYDGTPKRLSVSTSDSSVTVTYDNNDKIAVGTYRVFAHIVYPSGRTDDLSAEMIIVKATPVIVFEDSYVIYQNDAVLSDDIIVGHAYVGNNFAVSGTFSFLSKNPMRTGSRSYEVIFTPDDTHDVNAVTTGLETTVKCYALDGSLLSFRGEYTDMGEGVFRIKDKLVGELNREYIQEISDRVELYQNGDYVRNFVFKEEKTELIEIRFDNVTVFSRELEIEFYPQETEKKDVKIDESFFVMTDFDLDLESNTLYISEGGGVLSLSEEYEDTYALYVNGIQVGASGYSLSSEDKYITIEIRHKTFGTAYRKQFAVKDSSEKDSSGQKFKGLPTYVYVIIAVAGVLVLFGIVMLFLKRR